MKGAYVTGAGGFLGRKLCEKLDGFVAIPHTKIQKTELEPYKRFFFLSTYGNKSTHSDPSAIVKANISDLTHILKQTDFENGLSSFVFISSSSVGRRVQTMYSRTKRAAEEILLGYMETFRVPICIIRPFTITGVGEQSYRLIPKLIDSCLNNTQMPFVPEPTHDFINVEDVVDGILALSERHAKGVFELGTGICYSNQEVKEMVEDIAGKKANTRLVKNMRAYDGGEWVSKNFAARRFGWEPRKTLYQCIEEMVKHERTK